MKSIVLRNTARNEFEPRACFHLRKLLSALDRRFEAS